MAPLATVEDKARFLLLAMSCPGTVTIAVAAVVMEDLCHYRVDLNKHIVNEPDDFDVLHWAKTVSILYELAKK